MILYAVPLSSYCAKVRLCLALKGRTIDVREPPGGTYRSAEYRAIVPSGTIPAIVDGDFVLAESDTILEYLEEVFPDPQLLPVDPKARARARLLGRLHDLHLEPRVRALFADVQAGRMAGGAAAAIQAKLDAIEANLDAEGPFAIGSRPGLADCAYPATFAIIEAFMPLFDWKPDFGRRTLRWQAASRAHPAFETVIGPYRATVAEWIRARRSPN
ncbi:MAG: glutathione S-transferase family protein [Rhodospirillales bacterium]|nr:glutathione S-transferase family protein [Rhodospirillales bacterium]